MEKNIDMENIDFEELFTPYVPSEYCIKPYIILYKILTHSNLILRKFG